MKILSTEKQLIARIEALERAVFGSATTRIRKPKRLAAPKDNFTGATGGLRLLISNGFFDSRRKFSEIESEMKKHGYHYSKQAIQTPLNRLSTQRGPLVGLKQEGRKAYAKRK